MSFFVSWRSAQPQRDHEERDVSMHSRAAKPKTEAAPGKAAAPIEQSNACTERKPRESFRLREKAAASAESANKFSIADRS